MARISLNPSKKKVKDVESAEGKIQKDMDRNLLNGSTGSPVMDGAGGGSGGLTTAQKRERASSMGGSKAAGFNRDSTTEQASNGTSGTLGNFLRAGLQSARIYRWIQHIQSWESLSQTNNDLLTNQPTTASSARRPPPRQIWFRYRPGLAGMKPGQ